MFAGIYRTQTTAVRKIKLFGLWARSVLSFNQLTWDLFLFFSSFGESPPPLPPGLTPLCCSPPRDPAPSSSVGSCGSKAGGRLEGTDSSATEHVLFLRHMFICCGDLPDMDWLRPSLMQTWFHTQQFIWFGATTFWMWQKCPVWPPGWIYKETKLHRKHQLQCFPLKVSAVPVPQCQKHWEPEWWRWW